MEIKHHERGLYRGCIDLRRSMQTMNVGEEWQIPEGTFTLQTVRNACSLLSRESDMLFTSQCPGFTEPYIKVVRIK